MISVSGLRTEHVYSLNVILPLQKYHVREKETEKRDFLISGPSMPWNCYVSETLMERIFSKAAIGVEFYEKILVMQLLDCFNNVIPHT